MPAPILPWQAGIRKAASLIDRGKVVAIPTETWYGLAADPRNPAALARIYEIKMREGNLQLPLVGGTERDLFRVAGDVDPKVRQLACTGWPGAFSVVVPAGPDLCGEFFPETVAFRVSSHPVVAHLVRLAGFPVTATSANLSGQPPAGSAAACAGLDVDLVLDAGPSPGGKPSTLVRPVADGWEILRPGPVDPAALPAEEPRPDWTWDRIPGIPYGTYQSAKGVRFTLDSVLLSDFAVKVAPRDTRRVLDAGSGSGVCAFLVHHRIAGAFVHALELDADAVAAGRLAVRRQGLAHQIEFIEGDLAHSDLMLFGNCLDLVVSNPPYFLEPGRQASFRNDRRMARHDEQGFLAHLFACAQRVLRPGGRLCVIVPVQRFADAMGQAGKLHAADMCMIHPRVDQPANRVLLSFVKSRRIHLTCHPPLVVHAKDGYSPVVNAMLSRETTFPEGLS